MTTQELLLTSLGINAALIAAAVVTFARLRERLAKLEEWARLAEKRLNGLP